MTNPIIETVLFKLEAGKHEAFLDAIEGSRIFMESCSGFVARRLSYNDDGQWIEHVQWETMADAKAAASKIGSDPNTQAFVKCIDGPSVQMFHTELIAAVN